MEKYNNRVSLSILLILLVILFTIGCAEKQDQDMIRIGAVLPLTGELSFLGSQDKNALTLYQEQNNEVKFIFEDSKGTSKDGLSSVNKLLSQDVRYYITSLSYIINTVQPVLDKNKSANFTLNMDPRSEESSKYCLRLYVTFFDEMDKLVELAVENQVKKVAVLYTNVESANNAVENYLATQLTNNNIELFTETYDIGNKDFKNQLLKLSAHNPEIIRIFDIGDKLNVILNQMAELQVFTNTIILSGIETLVNDYTKFPEILTQKFIFTTPKLVLDESNPIIVAYKNKYGDHPSFDALFAYDIANLIVPIIKKKGYENVDEVIAEILNMKTYQGYSALYEVNQDGGISPQIYYAKIDQGNIVFIE